MTTKIELEDINVESLSKETLDLVSQLVAAVRHETGISFSFNDPYLLTKLRKAVKKTGNPKIKAVYYQYTFELRRSVNRGQFKIRPFRLTAPAPGKISANIAAYA